VTHGGWGRTQGRKLSPDQSDLFSTRNKFYFLELRWRRGKSQPGGGPYKRITGFKKNVGKVKRSTSWFEEKDKE